MYVSIVGVVLDTLLWFFVLVPPFLVLWVVVRLGFGLARAPPPPWARTPLDFVIRVYLLAHRVRVIDADGANAAGALHVPGVDALRGALLMNHRSWGDFAFDVYQGRCSNVTRFAAFLVTGLGGVVALLSGRTIIYYRGSTTRQQLQAKCASHERYLIYPEGTRRGSAEDADEPGALRPGGLKNIHEAGLGATVVVAVDKELIVDERRGTLSAACGGLCGGGATIYRAVSPTIQARDHKTFDLFLAAVEAEWRRTWARAYRLRDEHQRGAKTETSCLL